MAYLEQFGDGQRFDLEKVQVPLERRVDWFTRGFDQVDGFLRAGLEPELPLYDIYPQCQSDWRGGELE